MNEIWRDVLGWEGCYQVSNLGGVRSLSYKGTKRLLPMPLCPWANKSDGRKKIRFVGSGRREGHWISALVLTTFVGPRPSSAHQCCHNDGDASNDNVENLRWGTCYENAQDACRHGTAGSPVLDADDIRCIRAEPNYRGAGVMLARAFNVTPANISRIRSGQTWNYV